MPTGFGMSSVEVNDGLCDVFVWEKQMAVSENNGTPKSSILMGFSIINHPFWGTLIFGNTQMNIWRPKLPPKSQKKDFTKWAYLYVDPGPSCFFADNGRRRPDSLRHSIFGFTGLVFVNLYGPMRNPRGMYQLQTEVIMVIFSIV